MTDKILEAVKALGGDIENINSSDGDRSNYVALCVRNSSNTRAISGEYWDVDSECNQMVFKKICTAEEFNTASAEWLKEAYMHNAAIDLEWDINNAWYDGEPNLHYYKDGRTPRGTWATHGERYKEFICTAKEFIDYCAANKPQSQIETPEEKEVFDMIEAKQRSEWNGEGLPPVGCVVDIKYKYGNRFDGVTINYISDDVIVYAKNGEGERFGAMSCIEYIRPLESPRNKAIEAIYKARFNDDSYAVHSSGQYEFYRNAELFVDWLKSLTPEQKKEFGL